MGEKMKKEKKDPVKMVLSILYVLVVIVVAIFLWAENDEPGAIVPVITVTEGTRMTQVAPESWGFVRTDFGGISVFWQYEENEEGELGIAFKALEQFEDNQGMSLGWLHTGWFSLDPVFLKDGVREAGFGYTTWNIFWVVIQEENGDESIFVSISE